MSLETIAITTGGWLWDKFGQEITNKAIGIAKKQWKEFSWHEAEQNYLKSVKELYGTMHIFGMPDPVPLEDIFTDVYILDKQSALRSFSLDQIKQDPTQLKPKQRLNALSIVAEKEHLFILGKPGAGKTTFLKYVALQAAEDKFAKTPIFVYLKEWSDSGLELMAFLVKQFEICAFPDALPFIESLLQTGQALILFDGLDEVSQENDQRANLTTNLNNFAKQYRTCSCLITCRIAATDYIFEHFSIVEMADFSDDQIYKFTRKWFKVNQIKRDKFFQELNKPEYRGLRDLARTPLLLTLLCLAFDETMSFPQRLADLYEKAVDALLEKWDSSRTIIRDEIYIRGEIYKKLSSTRKRQLFARIAAETFEKNDIFFPQNDLVKRIESYLQTLPSGDTGENIDGKQGVSPQAQLAHLKLQSEKIVEKSEIYPIY